MRKRSVIFLSIVGGIVAIAYVLFTFTLPGRFIQYIQFDKDISETYKVELKQVNPRSDATLIEAPVLYKVLGKTTLESDMVWRDLEYIDQVKIWTKNDTAAFFLGENKPYIKLDLVNNQEFIYENLGDYSLEDQDIFQKLEELPNKFLEAQEPPYRVKGRGEVSFSKLK